MNRNAQNSEGNRQRREALTIVEESIQAVLPEAAVKKALADKKLEENSQNSEGKTVVLAIGKAAWNMAKATKDVLGEMISTGIVLTKYEHSQGPIPGFEIVEAGHPIPDENSVIGTEKALKLVSGLTAEDQVIFLISGGGSAIFEKPMEGVTLKDIKEITNQLLNSGADIVEINTVRKHLSAVKGGKFAAHCGKAKIHAIVLSDVIGDRLDSIASGPAYPDQSTSEEALEILDKYQINVQDPIKEKITIETPKVVKNCETVITGSVRALCEAAENSAKRLGYQTMILSTTLGCEAKEAGRFMAAIAREVTDPKGSTFIERPCAVIVGGETVVQVTGSGKGGRNQELALSAALGIEGLKDVVLFSLGSDGTDGPTDAAGGIVDGSSTLRMKAAGIAPETYLNNNDSYNALKATGDLLITGSTGTNVNDVVVLLCR